MYSGLPNELDTLINQVGPNVPLNTLYTVERSLREWLKAFAQRYIESDGRFKTETARDVLTGKVRASDLEEGSVAASKLAPGSIRAEHLASGVIQGSHIASGTLTGDQIAQGTIRAEHLAVNSITGEYIATGSLGSAHVIPASLPGSALVPGSVTGDRIAQRAITGVHLPQGTPGQVLLGGQTVEGQSNCFAPVAISGDLSVGEDGVVRLASGFGAQFARVCEIAPTGVAVNVTFPTGQEVWAERGLAIPWREDIDEGSFVELRDANVLITAPGTYFIVGLAPIYNDGATGQTAAQNVIHRAVLMISSGLTVKAHMRWFGTTEFLEPKSGGSSIVMAMVRLEEITSAAPAVVRMIQLVRRTASASYTVRLGTAANIANVPETYASLQIMRYQ